MGLQLLLKVYDASSKSVEQSQFEKNEEELHNGTRQNAVLPLFTSHFHFTGGLTSSSCLQEDPLILCHPVWPLWAASCCTLLVEVQYPHYVTIYLPRWQWVYYIRKLHLTSKVKRKWQSISTLALTLHGGIFSGLH